MKSIFILRMKSITTMAWMLVKKYSFSFGDAMKRAWAISKLKVSMYTDEVCFKYKKLNGEVRLAYGTLNHEVIPSTIGESRANDTLVTYYDCGKMAWRSFKVSNFIGVV